MSSSTRPEDRFVGSPTDKSFVSVASTATTFIAANNGRKAVSFQVPTTLTSGLWINWGASAGNGTAGSYFFPVGTVLVILDTSIVGFGGISYWTATASIEVPATEYA